MTVADNALTLITYWLFSPEKSNCKTSGTRTVACSSWWGLESKIPVPFLPVCDLFDHQLL